MTLTLRPATWRDLPRLRRWRNDPETVRWSNGRRVGWGEHLRWWLWRHRRGSRVFVAMVNYGRYTETYPVGVGRIDVPFSSPWLSYTIAPGRQGQGLGAALVAALVARVEPEHWVIWAKADPNNIASRCVLERNGFKLTSQHDRACFVKDCFGCKEIDWWWSLVRL